MNTIGENIKLTIFGESHGDAIGMVLDGFPVGEQIDMERIKDELTRRAPGGSEIVSGRKETDRPSIISGVFNGHTTGSPICAMIPNLDIDSTTYHPELPRPGHADLTAQIKFKGRSDFRGGGPFSGRLTAPMVLAGAMCKQVLERRNIFVRADIIQIGDVKKDSVDDFDFAAKKEILAARSNGDSVGGAVECTVSGMPAGVGGLMFGGMESRIAQALYAIPGLKALEFGAGFQIAKMRGSEANDPIVMEKGRIFTETNNSGGINGGITNGMPLVLRCALRPTPSISREQKTVDLLKKENTTIRTLGRHDPCIVSRALPVVEAMVAFCILDAMCED